MDQDACRISVALKSPIPTRTGLPGPASSSVNGDSETLQPFCGLFLNFNSNHSQVEIQL